ncbi:MAG: nucleoside-diphosphate kinase [Candidatus Parcubacteria bacterium]|nr:MAG: nucleoside-diphosphate kinase [Candidatus Parcubacteria bacterium]
MKNSYWEKTLVLIKPDGVERKLVGEIISRFERAGLKIIGLGITKPTVKVLEKHYPNQKNWVENLGNNLLKTAQEFNIKVDLKKDYKVNNTYELGKQIRNWLINFMASGPVVKIALEGENAISAVRKIVGKTIPLLAEAGTIRGDFATDSPLLANLEKRPIKNLVHASGNKEEAEKELKLWFKKSELLTNY